MGASPPGVPVADERGSLRTSTALTSADQPPGALRDVIEIGVCLLGPRTGGIEHAGSVLVRPSSTVVTPYCAELTGITPERASTGLAFVDACAWLQSKYRSEQRAWASYGAFDFIQLATQCEREGVAFPLSDEHINIKLLAALRLGLRKGRGLGQALSQLGMDFEGRPHSARDDAVNAARVLHAVLRGPVTR